MGTVTKIGGGNRNITSVYNGVLYLRSALRWTPTREFCLQEHAQTTYFRLSNLLSGNRAATIFTAE